MIETHAQALTSVFVVFASKVLEWFHRLGGPGLILLGIVDNSLIPVPGSMDVLVILLSAYHRAWWPYYALMAMIGAVVGGFFTFRLGEKGGEETLEKKIGKKRAQKIYALFRKRGFSMIVINAVLPPPVPMSPMLIAAGAMHYPLKRFFASLSIGRAIRFFTVAYLGHIYGGAIISGLSQYYKPVLYTLLSLAALAGVGVLVYFKWYRPRRQHEERQHGERVEQFPLPHLKKHR
ncbi:MAG: YqaA family protein [Candidatus Acidiferrales bacterium]